MVPLGGSLGDGSGVSVSQPVPPRGASIVLPARDLCKVVRSWSFHPYPVSYPYLLLSHSIRSSTQTRAPAHRIAGHAHECIAA